MNFYSCPLSFNEHICLAQHSIRQGRCVIFFGSVQQTWLCPLDISSTTVDMLARHQLNNCDYARWTSAPPTLPLLVHASLPIFIGRPPVPPPPPAPRAGHTPASPGIWLCAEVSIMRHDNHSETSLVRGETPGHRVMLKALNKPHYRYVAIAQKSAIFFLKSLFHQADIITKASLY
jgi:hypothetical protein